MKRKLFSMMLALAMTLSMTLPAAAVTTDDRLTEITTQIKHTLELDTEEYTQFYGELGESLLSPTWYLEWSGEDSTLTISATEEGKIINYYLRDHNSGIGKEPNSFMPSFPTGDREQAREAAQAFAEQALGEDESILLEDQGSDRLGMTSYRFRGEILVNGIPTDMSCSVSVRCADNVIQSYYRDDWGDSLLNEFPSPEAVTTQEQARTLLRDTLKMRLEYVLPRDGTQAVLRYLPEYGDEYYVDAMTGALVNLTELRQELEKGEGGMNGGMGDTTTGAKPETAPDSSLSGAEQAGIEKLEGVLDRDALDASVRKLTALGLDAYTLSTVHYSVLREDEQEPSDNTVPTVTAALQYSKQVNGNSWRRTVTVDAKTGELIRLYSSAWMPEEAVERAVDAEAAQETVKEFLNELCGTQFAKTALYNSMDALEQERTISHSFTFAQQENGYFYPDNNIYVGVDATDGSISSYGKNFKEDVTFDTPEGIVSMDAAIDAWLNTYTVKLGYIMVPTAIDPEHPQYQALKDYGIPYLYKMVLGYDLEREEYLQGIDAKSGQPIQNEAAVPDDAITYRDVEGHWAQDKIEKLAKYGIGYHGGAFCPEAALTQLDLLALLVRAQGYQYDTTNPKQVDELYQVAYRLGLLEQKDRNEQAELTRAQTVALLLDGMGYGFIARLDGIFKTVFVDDADIPEEYYGHVALAQGLGLVGGNPGGIFAPNDTATRAQAAVMLYNLMEQ